MEFLPEWACLSRARSRTIRFGNRGPTSGVWAVDFGNLVRSVRCEDAWDCSRENDVGGRPLGGPGLGGGPHPVFTECRTGGCRRGGAGHVVEKTLETKTIYTVTKNPIKFPSFIQQTVGYCLSAIR